MQHVRPILHIGIVPGAYDRDTDIVQISIRDYYKPTLSLEIDAQDLRRELDDPWVKLWYGADGSVRDVIISAIARLAVEFDGPVSSSYIHVPLIEVFAGQYPVEAYEAAVDYSAQYDPAFSSEAKLCPMPLCDAVEELEARYDTYTENRTWSTAYEPDDLINAKADLLRYCVPRFGEDDVHHLITASDIWLNNFENLHGVPTWYRRLIDDISEAYEEMRHTR